MLFSRFPFPPRRGGSEKEGNGRCQNQIISNSNLFLSEEEKKGGEGTRGKKNPFLSALTSSHQTPLHHKKKKGGKGKKTAKKEEAICTITTHDFISNLYTLNTRCFNGGRKGRKKKKGKERVLKRGKRKGGWHSPPVALCSSPALKNHDDSGGRGKKKGEIRRKGEETARHVGMLIADSKRKGEEHQGKKGGPKQCVKSTVPPLVQRLELQKKEEKGRREKKEEGSGKKREEEIERMISTPTTSVSQFAAACVVQAEEKRREEKRERGSF